MTSENYKREFADAGVQGGFDTGPGRFDLGVPGLVAECIEALYKSTGVPVSQKDRLPFAAVGVGVLIGMGFGFHQDGMLYGPIGAALGVVFGAVGGAFAGVILHFAAMPLLRPEAEAIKQVRLGNFRNAGRVLRSAGLLIWHNSSVFRRLARLVLAPLGIGRSDLPPEIASANITACEGILAESVGDVEEAANSYLRALSLWPRHTFVLAGLMELVIIEGMWDRTGEVLDAARRFLDRARDPRLIKTVTDHMNLIEKAVPEEKKEEWRLREEEAAYGATEPEVVQYFRILENPGSQISNGFLIVIEDGDEKELKLAAMPFHLVLTLAESLGRQSQQATDQSQVGWVTIQDMLDSLPWTTAHVTNSNVHKLVYKVRTQLANAGIDRNLIEENQNGCYRLRIPPERITIEMAVKA